jgi:hypothetical protein
MVAHLGGKCGHVKVGSEWRVDVDAETEPHFRSLIVVA